jgi:hypothetical protein
MKLTMTILFATIALVFTACGSNPDSKVAASKKADSLAARALIQSLPLESGEYTLIPRCLDTAKSASLRAFQYGLKIHSDGSYLYSEKSLEPNCTETCSHVTVGTYKLTALQLSLKVVKVLDEATGQFVAPPEDQVSPALDVLTYDKTTSSLTLMDETATNICQGRMVWTMSL